MPTLLERIDEDYKTALKAGDRLRVDALRLIKAGAQKAAIDNRQDALDDPGVIQFISQQAKQRRETIESVKGAGRDDVVKQTEAELAILTAYLTKQLSETELKQLIEEAVGAAGTNQGAIIKHVMGRAADAADGKVVSRLVADRLKNV